MGSNIIPSFLFAVALLVEGKVNLAIKQNDLFICFTEMAELSMIKQQQQKASSEPEKQTNKHKNKNRNSGRCSR